LLFLRALQMCLWRHPSHLPPPYEGYRDDDWQDNDGALNTVSQLYPRIPHEHPHCELDIEFNYDQVLEPGIWYDRQNSSFKFLFIYLLFVLAICK
jgi:hypothetical protein